MIWVGGVVVPDDALRISVLDRTFEHGLGLFETLRTWNGVAPLLKHHLERMKRSARELGIAFPTTVPDARAVKELLQAEQVVGDVILRITLSGGLNESSAATLWMRTATIPLAMNRTGAVVDVGTWLVSASDPFARHKTLNYWSRRHASEWARSFGFDEVLSTTEDGRIWEGSRTNLFAVQSSFLITPSLDGPIVPGIMRSLVIEAAQDLPLTVNEVHKLTPWTLASADEIFLTNSVRGIIPVSRVGHFSRPAPGEWTRRLQILLADRMDDATASLSGEPS